MGDLSEAAETGNNNTQKSVVRKSASLKDLCKPHKPSIMKWNLDRKASIKSDNNIRTSNFIKKTLRGLSMKKREDGNMIIHNVDDNHRDHEPIKTPKQKKKNRSRRSSNDDDDDDDVEELQISSPKLLSRTTSWMGPDLCVNTANTLLFDSNVNNINININNNSNRSSFQETMSEPSTPRKKEGLLSKVSSGKRTTTTTGTPILFSQSSSVARARKIKPPPVEKKLECSLEELCFGCVKKILITRDAISTTGLIVEEEETLVIKVQPGWKKGTNIKFEGKGDERPGTLPADIIFVIDEKTHTLFERSTEGDNDDLDLGVEVPLVQALTGCTDISVPLLGGEEMALSIDEIIYPGFEKVISGQGMAKTSEDGTLSRGDLRLKFSVDFPLELSDEQKSEVVSILQESFLDD